MRNAVITLVTISFMFILLGLFIPVLEMIGMYLLVAVFVVIVMEIGRVSLPGKGVR